MIFMDKDKENTIILLESLKSEIKGLYKGNAIAFASKTIDLLKKSVGQDSEQVRLMVTLLYDQTANHIERIIYPSDSLIVERVKMNDTFTTMIDNAIEFVNKYGLYKSSSEKKNFLGDFDNSWVWTFLGLVITSSFLIGVFTMNFGLFKYFDLNGSQSKTQSDAQNDVQSEVQIKASIDTVKTLELKQIPKYTK